jgi:tRNA-dihydrouridine synthase
MVEETGCDAVMIGRTAASNPWIFRQIAEYLATGVYSQPTEQMRYEIMRHYFRMLVDQEALDIVGKMKQFATHFTHGVRNGTKLRVSIYGEKTPETIIARVDEFFSQELVAA